MSGSARQLPPLGSGMGGFRRAAAGTAGTQPWPLHSGAILPVGDKVHDLPVSLACASCPTAGHRDHGDSRGRHPCFTAGRPRKTLEGDTHASQRGDHEKLSREDTCFTAWRCHIQSLAARRRLVRSSTRMALRCTGSDLKLCLPPRPHGAANQARATPSMESRGSSNRNLCCRTRRCSSSFTSSSLNDHGMRSSVKSVTKPSTPGRHAFFWPRRRHSSPARATY